MSLIILSRVATSFKFLRTFRLLGRVCWLAETYHRYMNEMKV